MQKVMPFLWYEKDAIGAARYYRSVFGEQNVSIDGEENFSDPFQEGVQVVSVSIFGVQFQLMAAGKHQEHNDMISFAVTCKDQAEVDAYWDGLTADGGQESQCGWCIDKYGIRWQIIPERYYELMSDPDKERSGRAVQAMMGMKKLIVSELEAAAEGKNG